MAIFLPTAAALVNEAKKATDPMWAWMRDITAGFNGGGAIVTSVTATTPIVSSGGATPNLTHANSGVTAATYGDATHVAQVAINATGHITLAANVAIAGLVKGTVVTLTNAQIKALPTTPIVVIPGPGASTRLTFFLLDLQTDFAAGAYTNVNTTLAWIGAKMAGSVDVGSYIANDSGILLTYLTSFLDGSNKRALLQPFTQAEPVNNWGNLAVPQPYDTNTALQLYADNNGMGNYTGGHAANTLRVTPYFTTAAVS